VGSNKLKLINLKFAKSYKKCKENQSADRMLFVNSVDMLVSAVKEFEALKVKSVLIKMSFSDMYEKKMYELEQLEASLKERIMI
jgi:pantothenate kinase